MNINFGLNSVSEARDLTETETGVIKERPQVLGDKFRAPRCMISSSSTTENVRQRCDKDLYEERRSQQC